MASFAKLKAFKENPRKSGLFFFLFLIIFFSTNQLSFVFGNPQESINPAIAEVFLPFIFFFLLLSYLLFARKTIILHISKPYTLLLFFFIFSLLPSFKDAMNKMDFFKDLVHSLFFTLFLYPFTALVEEAIFQNKVDSHWALETSIVWTGVIFAVIGLFQFFYFYLTGINFLTFLEPFILISSGERLFRATSLFSHYNAFGLFMLAPFVISIYGKYYRKTALIIFFLISLATSGSRGIVISLILLPFIYMFILGKISIKQVSISFTVLILSFLFFYFFSPANLYRFMFRDLSAIHRVMLQFLAFSLAMEKPLFGWGLGNFQNLVFSRYRLTDASAENTYLTVFTECGLFGLIGLLLLLAYPVKRLWKYKEKDQVARVLLVLILIYLINFIYHPFAFTRGIGFLFWFLLHWSEIYVNKLENRYITIKL